MLCIGLLVLLTVFLDYTACIEDTESNTFLYPGDDGNIYRVSLVESIIQQELENYTPPTLLLYTKSNPKTPFVLTPENISDSNFDKNLETVFLFHGWKDRGKGTFGTVLKNAYLKAGDLNVIVVDWKETSKKSPKAAVIQMPLVAADVIKVLDALVSQGMTGLDRITMVGHSFGSHLGAITAKTVKGGKVAALVGLDPVAILYDLVQPPERIAATDANYVQAIHTVGGTRIAGRRLGHADFYPNGGRHQPGCRQLDFSCSHSRSYKLMAASVARTHDYVGFRCDTLDQVENGNCSSDVTLAMGGVPLEKGNGIFYLKTGDEAEEDLKFILEFYN